MKHDLCRSCFVLQDIIDASVIARTPFQGEQVETMFKVLHTSDYPSMGVEREVTETYVPSEIEYLAWRKKGHV